MHMRTMPTVEVTAIVESDGSVRVPDLPYAPGERVRVFVVGHPLFAPRKRTEEELAKSRDIRENLKGSVLRYDDPTEPVGLEDWEVLRGENPQ